MATATILESVVIVLKLSADEANWLKAVMQNPLVEDESPTETRFRELLYTALDNPIK